MAVLPARAPADAPRSGVKSTYITALFAGVLTVAVASFYRDRGELFSNVSLWLFGFSFCAALINQSAGLVFSIVVLCLAPALHEQLNALIGTKLHAWTYPGVDVALGFLTAWAITSGPKRVVQSSGAFPSALLAIHLWVVLSAAVAVTRNTWQSASELSYRGLVYNGWLVRGISWNDDYYPLQDAYFYSVALLLVFVIHDMMETEGDELLPRIIGGVLAAAAVNSGFAVLQRGVNLGWNSGNPSMSANAFWPDLHSFGAFMAVAVFVAFGALRVSQPSQKSKVFLVAALVAAASGLFLSGSRSTLLLTVLSMTALLAWVAFRSSGRLRWFAVLSGLALLLAIDVLLEKGYRGVSYEVLRGQLAILSFDSFNDAFKQRPEMWLAALRMYSAFPFFGLGQGTFYRLSAIPDFSRSDTLVSMGGSGAHNYFLQTFAELGLVGLCLALFFCWSFISLGRRNLALVSFYAFVGIAVGNIYAHALLVRESLMLASVFLGIYLWEARRAGVSFGQTFSKGVIAWGVAGVFAVFVTLASIEVVRSFQRFPFKFGEKCFVERSVGRDGWISGVFRSAIPSTAEILKIAVLADRSDLQRRPFKIYVSVVTDGRDTLTETVRFQSREEIRQVTISLLGPKESSRYLEIKASHCYVPLNLGLTYDPRLLGVRVVDMQFLTASGALVR